MKRVNIFTQKHFKKTTEDKLRNIPLYISQLKELSTVVHTLKHRGRQTPVIMHSKVKTIVNNVEGKALSLSPSQQFVFTTTQHYLQLDCSLNEHHCKEDMIKFLQSAKPILKENSKSKLLVIVTSDSSVNIGAWSVLTKIKFNKTPFQIAVVAGSIHQALLLTKLAQLNNNIKAFTDKKTAVQWLTNY